MEKENLIINLDLPANERWLFLEKYKQEIEDLIECYLADFTGAEFLFDEIDSYKKTIISSEYLEEISSIASFTKFTENEILIANLYYDILKFYFGCTAFAVENNDTVFHARNLDWHTENDLLSKHSRVFEFQKNGETIFKSIGWVGFIGVLSGIKANRFSITLNAVLSKDSPEIAKPITFLLRDVLTNCNSFSEAEELLRNTTIICDCLLLLSGTNSEEKIVIERTPKRAEIRKPEENHIIVTNDYKKLENTNLSHNLLQETSCGRYNKTNELLNQKSPENLEDCISILKNPDVQMGITVQQMVFNNKTGEILFEKA
ncbi:C45 family peptidase [Aureivirga marina]|uniref:C45 family peptidase n=1 Tax=Aureivirga marina TaxID=1182451 RepID=UPI0018CB47AC|nr:C45 family peptidase [Aureivirga marina]